MKGEEWQKEKRESHSYEKNLDMNKKLVWWKEDCCELNFVNKHNKNNRENVGISSMQDNGK